MPSSSMRTDVSMTMMTVGGTRLMKSSGSSCAKARGRTRDEHVSAAKTPRQSSPGGARARRRGVVRAADRSCVGVCHHCTTRLPVDVFIRMLVSVLPGRLDRRLPRALVQLFLTALRDLAALDFGSRRARDGHLDDLVRAGRPEGFGVERERAVESTSGSPSRFRRRCCLPDRPRPILRCSSRCRSRHRAACL